jgi:hypothetical protein
VEDFPRWTGSLREPVGRSRLCSPSGFAGCAACNGHHVVWRADRCQPSGNAHSRINSKSAWDVHPRADAARLADDVMRPSEIGECRRCQEQPTAFRP